MPEQKKVSRYTVTAALPYANGPIHIGHLAGVYIPADIYCRYMRLRGQDVKFICGSDEHGVPVTIRAKKEGITVQEAVDKYHELIKSSFADFGISFDIYSRTSAQVHHETSSAFFKKLYDEGKFEEQVSEQFFDPEANQFLADRYIQGTCPKCGYEHAYGDQCENCGSTLSPAELINPRSMMSGAKPIMKETKHWYLPLNQYEDWLREYILEDHKEWKPNVYGQCKSWLDGGLQPRAVTRDLDWGVPVPVEGAEGKVLYVWFDAPIGYISATKELAERDGFDWKDYWQNPDAKLIHFIGKDNIVFHCIIFPTMLHAHGDYVVPHNVPANEFLNLEGNKISTSRNWAVWLHEYLQELPFKQDVLRYALTANAPETKDNDFTWKDFQTRNNSELVAIFGNFVNRAVVLTHKFFNGKVPAAGTLTANDEEVLAAVAKLPEAVGASIENYKFREGLTSMMEVARIGNKYLAEQEPWKTMKVDEGRTATVLHVSLQIAAALAIISEPFLPFTAKKLRDLLNLTNVKWEAAENPASLLKEGVELAPATLLFDKIEDEVVEAQVQKLLDTKVANEMEAKQVPAAKPEVLFEDFTKMDIRTATILTAEAVPKTKKLLKLSLDTGLDKRTVVSGIAEHFSPEEVVGKQVLLLANLAPREIKGIISQGMILMAEDKDGKLTFVQPSVSIWNGGTVS